MREKTIFLTVYDGDTEKVILRSGVLSQLLKSEHRIVLLIRGQSRLDYYRSAFGSERVNVELLPRATTWGEIIWHYITWNTVPTRAAYIRRRINFRKNPNIFLFLFETIAWTLGHIRVWREFLRFIYAISPDSYASHLFERYRPDLLFAPNMFSPEDFRMLRAAKRRGVRTITTAKSWDVLTTKAFTRVRADTILVFNEFNREEAIRLGDYRPEQVVVTGFPQFDVYYREELLISREEFARSLGIDAEKRFLLVAVPGDWKTPHTKEIILELDRRIENGRFIKPLHIIARLHPKYADSSEQLVLKHVTFDRPGTHFSTKKEFSVDMGIKDTYAWTFTEKDIAHLANSIRHSDIVINTESTLTLDAAANNRPSILIAYDGDATLPYWDSVARVYEREHYKHVTDTAAAPIVRSHDALEREINCFLEHPEYLRKERDELASKLLYKQDGASAKRVSDAVLEAFRQE